MENRVINALGQGVLEGFRLGLQNHVDDETLKEREIGIKNATSAMLELCNDEEKIIQMLQKYWDLRRSEAKWFIEEQKNKL